MIFPMFTMVVLIFVFMVYTLLIRISSVRSGTVPLKYFKLFNGDAPEVVIKTNRHFSNLFETPVLFFIAGTLCIVLKVESGFTIALAWIYVGLRCVHMYIHLTYNKILHRMIVFLLSLICILILWCAILAGHLNNSV